MLVTARAGQSLFCTAYDTKLLMMCHIVLVVWGFTCIAVQCFSALATSSSTPDTMEHNPSTCRIVMPEADSKCCCILFLQVLTQGSKDLCNGHAHGLGVVHSVASCAIHTAVVNVNGGLRTTVPAWPPSCVLQLLLFSADLLHQEASSQVELPATVCRLSGHACKMTGLNERE